MLRSFLCAVLVAAATLVLPTHASAQKLTTILKFTWTGGATPQGTLLFDSAGNLYGAMYAGGQTPCPPFNTSCGTVFKLSPPASGQTTWTENVLLSFAGANGAGPAGSLIADSAGNLYGTTYLGGTSQCSLGNAECGTVFKLSPPPAGQTAWTHTILFTFNGPDGAHPGGGLIFDKNGNLYGTTIYGGSAACSDSYGCGTVFKLSPPPIGQTTWVESVLLNFNGSNGAEPFSSLIFDAAGNLYGTTEMGGTASCPVSYGCGTVFKLAPPADGKTEWTQAVIFSFDGTNGYNLAGPLLLDGADNLYGVATFGGAYGEGAVFKLQPPVFGQTTWTETVLFSFDGIDGEYPNGTLTPDRAGNLYGTTYQGGGNGGAECSRATKACGTVFKLSRPVAGQSAWAETVITSFNSFDGLYPSAGVIFDTAGNLYGTTDGGGIAPCAPGGGYSEGCGTAFKLKP